jgi:hypothetical protein
MHIDINVQNTLLVTQKFNNTKDNVCAVKLVSMSQVRENAMKLTVNIAKPRCLAFLCVMQTPSPIYRDITFSAVEPSGPFHTAATRNSTELEQPVKYWTIIADIVFSLLFCILFHVIWGDFREEIHIFIGVKLAHFLFCCRFRSLIVEVSDSYG